MPKLNNTHPQYDDKLPIWELVEDCDEGQSAIKAKRETYLPKPNPTDTSEENKERYEQYIKRAIFVNFVNRTLGGLVGQVIAKEPEVELPSAIDNFKEDIDGCGISLDQQARRALRNCMKTGRSFLLVDYPAVEGEVKAVDNETGKIRPTITLFPATSVDLWRTERRGSKDVLTLVKIREAREMVSEDDPFDSKMEEIRRVLRLDDQGYYYQQIWAKGKDANNKEDWVQDGDDRYPLDATGSKWDEMPATFIGSINNDPDVDPVPMSDIANVNIGHYRNSADYEQSSYQVGQPTPVYNIGRITPDQFKDANDGAPKWGSLGGIVVGEGGSADLLQAKPNTMPKEAMEMKETQMAMLGARLVKPNESAITATQASIDHSGEISVLAMVAQNVSTAYETALEWFRKFLKAADGEIVYQLNTDFEMAKLDAQELLAVIQAVQSGLISKPAGHAYTVKVGLEDRDFDTVEDEIANNPVGLDLSKSDPEEESTPKTKEQLA